MLLKIMTTEAVIVFFLSSIVSVYLNTIILELYLILRTLQHRFFFKKSFDRLATVRKTFET
jgi:hypothetical protein